MKDESNDDVGVFSESSTWCDVTPIPMSPQVNELFNLKYDKDYSDSLSILRAVIQSGELSERVLELTSHLITIIPNNPAFWHVRRQCLELLGYDLKQELQFLRVIHNLGIKCYQTWNHRKWICNRDHLKEKDFLMGMISKDEKNFHAWEYAIWYATRWSEYKDIYDISKHFIQHDIFNNSAWNAVFQMSQHLDENIMELALNYMKVSTKNESLTHFIYGSLKRDPNLMPQVKETIEFVHRNHQENPIFLSFEAQVYDLAGENEKMNSVYDRLIDLQPNRREFWSSFKSSQHV